MAEETGNKVPPCSRCIRVGLSSGFIDLARELRHVSAQQKSGRERWHVRSQEWAWRTRPIVQILSRKEQRRVQRKYKSLTSTLATSHYTQSLDLNIEMIQCHKHPVRQQVGSHSSLVVTPHPSLPPWTKPNGKVNKTAARLIVCLGTWKALLCLA